MSVLRAFRQAGNGEARHGQSRPPKRGSPERPIVLDTKWKRLDSGKETLGIEESDVYQMLAYARAYGAVRLVLLYPWDQGMCEAEGVIRAWTVAAADSRSDFNCRQDVATIDVDHPDRNRVAGMVRAIVGSSDAGQAVSRVA